jgi:hypothetical protein
MRPHDRKTSAATIGVPRAKMFIKAHVAWLSGYPLAVRDGVIRWQLIDDTEVIDVGGKRLRNATYTITKLRNRYPRALPKVVGDVAAWEAGHRRALELLKPTVHRGEALPESLFDIDGVYGRGDRKAAAELVTMCSELSLAVAALSWIYCATPERAGKALSWLTRNYVELAAMAELASGEVDVVRLQLRLWRMAEAEGPRRVAPLIERLADRRVYETPIVRSEEHRSALQHLLSRKANHTGADVAIPLPDRTLSDHLLPWLERLFSMASVPRRRALRLLAETWPGEHLTTWSDWWKNHDRIVKQTRRALGRKRPRHLEGSTRSRLKDRIEQLVRDIPLPIEAALWLDAVAKQSEGISEGRFRVLARLLQRMPTDIVSPAMFLHDLSRFTGDEEHRVDPLLKGLRRYTSSPDFEPRWWEPWRPIGSGSWYDSINHDLVDELDQVRHFPLYFDALATLQRSVDGVVSYDRAYNLIDLATVTLDAERAAAYLLAAEEASVSDRWMPWDARKATTLMAGDDPAAYAELMKAWSKLSGEYTDTDAEGLLAAVRVFARRDRLSELRAVATAGNYKKIAEAGILVGLGGASKLAIPEPAAPNPPRRLPAWAARYPRELRDGLRAICDCHPEPERAAGRILGRDLPDPAKLEREIAALEERAAAATGERAAAMKTRLRNLRARLADPPRPSPVRLARLCDKLTATAAQALFDRWAEELDQQLRDQLPRRLPIDPAWIDRPGVRDVLAGIGKLESQSRKLALTLLEVRRDDPPWDLRDRPANRAFLDGLRDRGVDPDPWVNGVGELVRRRNQRTVRVAFEDDPLEVFRMGAHFSTCLRPGAMNFFSVFANAADINKRVVYARIGDTVVGRCLLALTDDGSIATFQPYCHDSRIGFDKIIGELCDALAEAMGTQRVTGYPRISSLVATRWYDDGIVAIAGAEEATDPMAWGSELRTSLRTVALDELVPALEAALGPLGERTLHQVVNLPELTDRPELILPLLPRIERADALPGETMIRTVYLLIRAGHSDAARRLSSGRIFPILRKSYEYFEWIDEEIADLLIELDPSAVLRLLRDTRHHGVRRWTDEVLWFRIFYGARALDALHRPAQARRLYRRVVELDAPARISRECKRRIDALS